MGTCTLITAEVALHGHCQSLLPAGSREVVTAHCTELGPTKVTPGAIKELDSGV